MPKPITLLILPLALLLCACPKDQRDATVTFAAGRPVFDGDRTDCIIRLTIAPEQPGAQAAPVWQTETPLPVGDNLPCPMRFPVTYGAAPPGIHAWPETAPPLQPGRTYRLSVDGLDADHGAEFRVP